MDSERSVSHSTLRHWKARPGRRPAGGGTPAAIALDCGRGFSEGCPQTTQGTQMQTMKRCVLAIGLLLAAHSTAWATWSVIALDSKTGQVIIASATCVRQAGFPQRQPNGAHDLIDVQAVIVPGVGVAACQAGVDNTRQNQMLVYNELKKGTPPPDILAMLKKDPDVERRQFGILLMPNGGTVTARNNRVGF